MNFDNWPTWIEDILGRFPYETTFLGGNVFGVTSSDVTASHSMVKEIAFPL